MAEVLLKEMDTLDAEAALRVVVRRQDFRKDRVEPADEMLAGAKVASQRQGFKGDAADARLP